MLDPILEENSRLRAILAEAVKQYGKPGGPWNVPSDPGGWIARAQDALNFREHLDERQKYELRRCPRCGMKG